VKTGLETVVLYVRAQMNLYPYCSYFLANLGQFRTRAAHDAVQQLLSFVKIRAVKVKCLHTGMKMNFCPYFPHLVFIVCEIQGRRSACNNAVHL
jgi:hypothetical protein